MAWKTSEDSDLLVKVELVQGTDCSGAWTPNHSLPVTQQALRSTL